MTLQDAANRVIALAMETQVTRSPFGNDEEQEAIETVKTHFASLRKVEEEMDAIFGVGIEKFAAELEERNAHLLQQRKNEHYFEKYSEED